MASKQDIINTVKARENFIQNLTLKPKQVSIVENLMDGKNVIAQLPTWLGKALIDEWFPLVMKKVTSA